MPGEVAGLGWRTSMVRVVNSSSPVVPVVSSMMAFGAVHVARRRAEFSV